MVTVFPGQKIQSSHINSKLGKDDGGDINATIGVTAGIIKPFDWFINADSITFTRDTDGYVTQVNMKVNGVTNSVVATITRTGSEVSQIQVANSVTGRTTTYTFNRVSGVITSIDVSVT